MLLEQCVRNSSYPPVIDLVVSCHVHTTSEYNVDSFTNLEIVGSSPHVCIPVKVVEWMDP